MNVSSQTVPERCVQIVDIRPVEILKAKLVRAKASLREKILLLPHPLDNVSRPRLCAYFVYGVGASVVALYGVSTGKAMKLGLKDRRLNNSGRASSVFMLGFGLVISLLSAHELWALESERD